MYPSATKKELLMATMRCLALRTSEVMVKINLGPKVGIENANDNSPTIDRLAAKFERLVAILNY